MAFLKKHITLTIIAVFHVVGFIGFLVNPHLFNTLTPVNLLLSAFLMVLMSDQTKPKFYATLLVIGVAGYFIEVIGVKTGFIFGRYYYGSALGYKFLSVPLLIGLNWILLSYSTSLFFRSANIVINALCGAALMVGLDFLMEQSAAKFNFWYWVNGSIPLQNYIAWFCISFLIHLLADKELSKKPNLTAKGFYIIQVIFFAALYFFTRYKK